MRAVFLVLPLALAATFAQARPYKDLCNDLEPLRKLAADAKGELRIPFEDSWIAANPTIELSEVPKKIGLAF